MISTTRPIAFRTLMLLALLAVILALTAGCHKPGDRLLGKWTESRATTGGRFTQTYDFHPDNTVLIDMAMGDITMAGQGTYTVTGNTLTITYKTATLTLPGRPAITTNKLKSPGSLTMEFKDNNTVVLHGNTDQTLTRVPA